jgi:hypothetical protein
LNLGAAIEAARTFRDREYQASLRKRAS